MFSQIHKLRLRFRSQAPQIRWLIIVLVFVIVVSGIGGASYVVASHHKKAVQPTVATTKGLSSVAGAIDRTHVTSGNSTTTTPTATQSNPSQPTTTPTQKTTSTKSTSSSTPPPQQGGGSSGGTTAPQTLGCAPKPSACGFPDATNTGPVGCSSYTQMSGYTEITTDNAVINCVNLTNGALDIYANNVTIQNSIIKGNNWWGINLRTGYSGLTVTHSTITGVVGQGPDNGGEDYAISESGTGPMNISYNNISEFGDAISVGDGNVHDNYVHDLQAYIPLCGSNPCGYYEHTDDIISDGNDSVGLTIKHNTMFNQLSTTQGASAAIGLFADNGPVSNVTVDNNLIAGGAYALYPGGGSTSSNIVVVNNHFSTLYWPQSGYYGADATTYWHSGSGNSWSGNVWDDGANAGASVSP